MGAQEEEVFEEEELQGIQETRAFHRADPETRHGEVTYRKNQSEVENRVLPSISPKHSLLEHILDHTAGVCK